MSSPELHLTLEQAKAGMMLARAVVDANGQLLMAQGTELSDTAIAALHRRNVKEICVFDPQQQAADIKADEVALRQHHQARMARLFRHGGNSADDCYLRDLMTRYRGVLPS